MKDTAAFKKDGPYTVCFSNAGVNNPWRVVGWTNMQQEVELHPEIGELIHVDAEGSDDKQIADIDDLLAGGKCSILIVSPNTTAALTPAVEKACAVLPVIIFDRGVNTDCPVTFIHPVGGYGFGIQGAEFIADNTEAGANVLMLRILPGVDVLETRYSAGKRILDEAGLNIVGAEFTDGDNAKTKSIVEDYLQRGTDRRGVDGCRRHRRRRHRSFRGRRLRHAGLRRRRPAGLPAEMEGSGPDRHRAGLSQPISGAPRSSPPCASSRAKPVPGPEWILPQPAITQDTLDSYINTAMPPLHYALCGCEGMPNYPAAWGGK